MQPVSSSVLEPLVSGDPTSKIHPLYRVQAVVGKIDDPQMRVYAEDQAEYIPLPSVAYSDGKIITEWILTEDERARILRGENIRLWVWTFNKALQPVALEVTGA